MTLDCDGTIIKSRGEEILTYEECKDIWIRSWRQQKQKNGIIDKSYEYNISTVCRRLQLNKYKYKERILKYFKRFKEEKENE